MGADTARRIKKTKSPATNTVKYQQLLLVKSNTSKKGLFFATFLQATAYFLQFLLRGDGKIATRMNKIAKLANKSIDFGHFV